MLKPFETSVRCKTVSFVVIVLETVVHFWLTAHDFCNVGLAGPKGNIVCVARIYGTWQLWQLHGGCRVDLYRVTRSGRKFLLAINKCLLETIPILETLVSRTELRILEKVYSHKPLVETGNYDAEC